MRPSRERAALDARLVDPASYGEANKDALKALIVDQATNARELADLEGQWFELHEDHVASD